MPRSGSYSLVDIELPADERRSRVHQSAHAHISILDIVPRVVSYRARMHIMQSDHAEAITLRLYAHTALRRYSLPLTHRKRGYAS